MPRPVASSALLCSHITFTASPGVMQLPLLGHAVLLSLLTAFLPPPPPLLRRLSKLLGSPTRSGRGWGSNPHRSARGGAPEAAGALPGQLPLPVSPCCSHEPYAPPPRCAPRCPRAARSRPSRPAPYCSRRPWRALSGSGAMAAGGGRRCSARGGALLAPCPAAAAGCTPRVSGGRAGERRARAARGVGWGEGGRRAQLFSPAAGDKAFAQFLTDEIKEERKIQKHKALPKVSGGWELEVHGTEARLVRKVAGEK